MSEEKKPENSSAQFTETKGWNKLLTPEGLSYWVQIALLISSSLYITGYLSWSVFAFQNHLGYLPAIREQYFIGGIVPVLLGVITILFIVGCVHFSKYKAQEQNNIVFRIVIISSITMCSGLITVFVTLSIGSKGLLFFSAFYISLLSGMYLLSALLTKFIFDNKIRALGFGMVMGFVFPLYQFQIFRLLPSEFGGPKETLVQLDITRENISPKTLTLVSDSTTRAENSKVFRSVSLYLIFDAGDFVLLKQKPGNIDSSNALLKIKRETIQGIFHCNQ